MSTMPTIESGKENGLNDKGGKQSHAIIIQYNREDVKLLYHLPLESIIQTLCH